jgi:hypothetical protein
MSCHGSDRRPKLLGHRATAWIAAGAGAGALYLLLIDTTSLPELIVLGVAAALAATGFELAREQETVGGLSGRLGRLSRIYRPLLKVPSDIATLSIIALRQLVRPKQVNGTFRTVPFRCGPEEETETGRRALAESLGSFAPNTIIVGIDVERELILAHQLHRTGGAETIDVLDLGSE